MRGFDFAPTPPHHSRFRCPNWAEPLVNSADKTLFYLTVLLAIAIVIYFFVLR